jgi:hypothetical protein
VKYRIPSFAWESKARRPTANTAGRKITKLRIESELNMVFSIFQTLPCPGRRERVFTPNKQKITSEQK